MQLALPASPDPLPAPALPPRRRRRPNRALHPPARGRGDGREAEQVETASSPGHALHRQRHHRAAPVHALAAHLRDPGPERRSERAGRAGARHPPHPARARSPGPEPPSWPRSRPSWPRSPRGPAGPLHGAIRGARRAGLAPLPAQPALRAPTHAHAGRRAAAPGDRSPRARAALAPRAGAWSGAATGPASWWGEGVVRARARPRGRGGPGGDEPGQEEL